MDTRCSWWATRCSRSIAFATRKWACFSRRAKRVSVVCGSRRGARRPIPPPPRRAPQGSVQLHLFPDDPAGEARALAARIAALRRLDPLASVAVLVAAHAHATPLVSELQALGVESLGVDLVPLAQRPVVRDLVQLTRALYDLADRGAWLAVLRAPWCGARLATLTALSAPEDPQLIWEALNDSERLGRCASAERERMARGRDVLAGGLERRETEPPPDWGGPAR